MKIRKNGIYIKQKDIEALEIEISIYELWNPTPKFFFIFKKRFKS